MLAAGANPDTAEPRLGKTAIHLATALRSDVLVALLLAQSSSADSAGTSTLLACTMKDVSGKTAIDIASSQRPPPARGTINAFIQQCSNCHADDLGAGEDLDGSNNFGREHDAAGTPRFSGDCPIPHVDAAALSTHHFVHDFMALSQPFIVRGTYTFKHYDSSL